MIIITTYHYSILCHCNPHLSYENHHDSIVQVHLRYNHHQNNYARIKSRSILRCYCFSISLQLSLNLRAQPYKMSLSFTGFCFCMTILQSASIKSYKYQNQDQVFLYSKLIVPIKSFDPKETEILWFVVHSVEQNLINKQLIQNSHGQLEYRR